MEARSRRVVAGWAIALTLGLTLASAAQERIGRPVYPGYQGFIDNPDGSVTMVFQYFSHSRDPVELPVGPDNSFNGVADRHQPTTFLPGNHEFVCVMVVESREAAHETRWTVAFPVEASVTSIDPLNTEYMLTERSVERANRDLDTATAPRNVCVNKSPVVVIDTGRGAFSRNANPDGTDEVAALDEIEAKLGEPLELRGFVNDEGLPRGNELTSAWKKVSGPGSVDFADATALETTATVGAAGTYVIELVGSDGERENSVRVRVEVAER